jgi:hypothetical protein
MNSKISKILIFSVLILLIFTGAAAAQEWVVTAPGDTEKVNTSTIDASNMTLRQAIAKASSGDTIVFAENITAINVLHGSLNISKDLTIGGNQNVIVRKDPSPVTQDLTIFTVSGSNVVFRQLTVENGNVMNGLGGAFLIDKADVTLDSCTIQRNKAGTGGAIYMTNGSNVKLNTVSIYRNNATTDGSAIYVKNGTVDIQNTIIEGQSDKYNVIKLEKGTLTITESRIIGNNVTDKGSPISADAGTTVEIRNTTISDNIGTESGGISTTGTLVIENSVFENGKSAGAGGAISMRDGSSGTIRYSIFKNNIANDDGGAIHQSVNSTVSITGCTFLNNAANYGGAFFGRGTFTIDSSTAINNTAKFYGGAIASWNDAKGTITKTIIASNTAKANNTAKDPAGGGLNISRSDVLIGSNVIVGNTDPRMIDFGEENATVRSSGDNFVGVYRGTTAFPINSSDALGITLESVFVIDGNGLPALTKSTGQTAGYNRVQVYTVELNSSPNNPAAHIFGGSQPAPQPEQPPEQQPADPTVPEPEPPAKLSIGKILTYILIIIVLIIILGVGIFVILRYNHKRKYKF